MKNNQDANTELDSSTDSEILDAAIDTAEKAVEVVDSAESSTAQDATAEDALSIVRDVVEKRTADPAATSSVGGEEAGSDPADTKTTKPKEPDNENFSDVPFHKHPRFQTLLSRTKAAEHDAGQFRQVQTFMDTNGITPEEAADAFIITGLIKTNPQKAWEKMKPIVQAVLMAAGEVLPEDLQGRVQKGELTQEAAFEVSRARAHVQSVNTQQTFRQQQDAREQQTSRVNALRDTAQEWENDRRVKDPNFEAKYLLLQKELIYLHATEGVANTPEGVKAQLKKAYDAVALPAAVTPTPQRRQAVKPLQSNGHTNGNAQPKPQSTLEIIRANRQAS